MTNERMNELLDVLLEWASTVIDNDRTQLYVLLNVLHKHGFTEEDFTKIKRGDMNA